jgi:GTPase SAR1 family protein
MGNNHNQYFGASKRKILLLGLEASGKTSTILINKALLQYLLTGKMIRDT